MKKVLFWLCWCVLSAVWILPVVAEELPTVQTNPSKDPQQLVKDITDSVLTRLQSQQEVMRKEPRQIYNLVEQFILPHFDFVRMSRWVLGRYWRQANLEQQNRFVMEFRNLLVRTYGVALLDYTDDKIDFLPMRGDPGQGEVVVRMNLHHRGSNINIDTNLYSLDGAWKVYDVVINGISLVTNYRTSFATEIRKSGIDGLIAKLGERNSGTDKN